MANRTILKFSLMIFSMILLGNLAAFAQKTDCSKQTDQELVLAVYAKIKAKYPDEVKNINVTATGGMVKLDGWVSSEKILKKIVDLVKKIKCVKQVQNELEAGKTGGCAPGQKECGGACINEKETCNVCLVEPAAPGCIGTTEERKDINKKP
jgi:hypothetical protein